MFGDTYRAQAPVLVAPLLHKDSAHCHDMGGLADPAHETFVPDTQAQHVVPAQVGILPPMNRAVAVEKAIAIAHVDCKYVAKILLCDQALNRRIYSQRMWCRHDLCDQLRPCARG